MKIEKNIPIPRSQFAKAGRPEKYCFSRMEVDDSIYVTNDHGKSQKAVRNSAYAHGKKYGKCFVVRSDPGGVRVWRVS